MVPALTGTDLPSPPSHPPHHPSLTDPSPCLQKGEKSPPAPGPGPATSVESAQGIQTHTFLLCPCLKQSNNLMNSSCYYLFIFPYHFPC